jgi:hypothetical protein
VPRGERLGETRAGPNGIGSSSREHAVLKPLQVFAEETSGKSYACHQYCFERHAPPGQVRDGNPVAFEVKASGESQPKRQWNY